jgi:uncharacterized membrane protein
MILNIYKKAAAVLLRKPILLWGLSLLSGILSSLASIACGIIPGLAVVVSLLLSTSMTMVYLHGYRGEKVKSAMLFECFKDWNTIKRVSCGLGWMILWLIVWCLVPIVGPIIAIVKAYGWRLTPYILVLEPNVPIMDAIKVSAKRTKGYKGKMLGADLLIYGILFVAGLVLTLLSQIPILGILFSFANVVVSIATALFLNLFLGLVQSAFYEEINANREKPQIPENV